MTAPSVSVIVPCLTEQRWQVWLTDAIIKIARDTTGVPFELIICEAVGQHFQKEAAAHAWLEGPDIYYRNPKRGFANADMNAGLDLATGDIQVLLTNDVFVKQDWLEALIECFQYEDCGIASLGTSDHKEAPIDIISEGLWCPLMAFRKDHKIRFDAETFPSYWGDSDLVMRVYERGLRAYRNRRVVCDHLGRATNTSDHVQGRAEVIEAAHQRFLARHGRSRQLMARVLMNGMIV